MSRRKNSNYDDRMRERESRGDRSKQVKKKKTNNEPKTTLYWPNDKDDSFCRHANLWLAIISSLHSNNVEYLMCCTVSTSTTCIFARLFSFFHWSSVYWLRFKLVFIVLASNDLSQCFAHSVDFMQKISHNFWKCERKLQTHMKLFSGNFPSKTLCCTEYKIRWIFPYSQVSAMQYK